MMVVVMEVVLKRKLYVSGRNGGEDEMVEIVVVVD